MFRRSRDPGFVSCTLKTSTHNKNFTARNPLAGREHIVVKGPADRLDQAGKILLCAEVFKVHKTNPGSRLLRNIGNVWDAQAKAGDAILFPPPGYSSQLAPRYGASLTRWTTIIFSVHYRWIRWIMSLMWVTMVYGASPSCLLLKWLSSLTGMTVHAESVAFLEYVKLASLP
jgi:hypothetical protein